MTRFSCACARVAADGQWSSWSDWEPCRASCGRQFRSRTCDKPAPQNCGTLCTGANKEGRGCYSGHVYCWGKYRCHIAVMRTTVLSSCAQTNMTPPPTSQINCLFICPSCFSYIRNTLSSPCIFFESALFYTVR